LNDIPLGVLFGTLLTLVILSGFFSGSETALMTMNRYRLRHLAKSGHRGALLVSRLLERPDRLLGLILLGNNFVNILASSLATVIALRLLGEAGIALAAGLLTLVILVFSEVAPKTLAAVHPERLAFPAAYVYTPLLKLLYPLVWVVNLLANSFLKLIGIVPQDSSSDRLSRDELRTLVKETGILIPKQHQAMLVNLLDLESVTVNDIMVPRNEIAGIDLEEPWEDISEEIANSAHSRLPAYRESIDNVIGFVSLRRMLDLGLREEFNRELLEAHIDKPYFIPEGTSLTRQLLNFQHRKRRIGLVVDEYGDILGLVTLEDILEEIVGEFTTDPTSYGYDIHPQKDGSYIADGGTNLRDLNRALKWKLATDGPKTLNGLILEYLETIPEPGTTFLLENHPIEIVQIKDNAVKSVRIHPAVKRRRPAKRN
jgi:Mg2+/Co2+ transporter CorB